MTPGLQKTHHRLLGRLRTLGRIEDDGLNSKALAQLLESGLVARRYRATMPLLAPRFEYTLTDRGRQLARGEP